MLFGIQFHSFVTSTSLHAPNINYKLIQITSIMSKRKSSASKEGINAKQTNLHWSLGLLESMTDRNLIYKETDTIVVIKDKYPKAKIHYLMIPKRDINSIYDLSREHTELLEGFGIILKDIREEHKNTILQAGFHAVPSMQRMHMHIISSDMVSPCLKTKVHWNSFTTSFFIPYEDLVKELKANGCIKKISSDIYKPLMATPLKCNQCDHKPKNMPQLKEHLITHVK